MFCALSMGCVRVVQSCARVYAKQVKWASACIDCSGWRLAGQRDIATRASKYSQCLRNQPDRPEEGGQQVDAAATSLIVYQLRQLGQESVNEARG